VELNEAESVILTVQFLLQKYGDLLMPDAEQAECITVLAPQPANPTT
jgi:hypothetical protein